MNETVTGSVWKELSRFLKSNRSVVDVAVAYVGRGSSALLKLPPGSRLVVDATEGSVKRGLTCPDDLAELQTKGVKVFCMPNLHAKVYAFSQRAYIGSANASFNSATKLIEAMFCTTDRHAVKQAKAFVRDLCLYPLTPEVLKRLKKIYRPPVWAGKPGKKGKKEETQYTQEASVLPRVCLAQLVRESWNKEDDRQAEIGAKTADKERTHDSGWSVERFRWVGAVPFRKDDIVLQVTEEEDGREMVSPPGPLLHIHPYNTKEGRIHFCYVETPERQRKNLDRLAKKLGPGGKKLLRTRGMIRKRSMAVHLLSLWRESETV